MRVLALLGCVAVALAAYPVSAQTYAAGDVIIGDLAGNVWAYDMRSSATRLLTNVGGPVLAVDVDHDGDLILGGAATLWLVSRDGSIKTTITGGPLVSFVADAEVLAAPSATGPRFLVSSMGSGQIWQMDGQGTVITQYTLPGETRAWGIGIRPATGLYYVCGLTAIHEIDPGTGFVRNVASGAPFAFLQSAHWGPNDALCVGDQDTGAVFEIDAQGSIITLLTGPPFDDVGEGVDYHRTGVYILTDDGDPSRGGNDPEALYALDATTRTLTTLAQGGFQDINGCAVVPELHVAPAGPNPKPGGRVFIDITSSGADGETYVFAASFTAAGPGLPLPGGKRLGLDFDDLFELTVQDLLPTIFSGLRGTLPAGGRAQIVVTVPGIGALSGQKFHVAGVAISPAAAGSIHLVSNTATVSID